MRNLQRRIERFFYRNRDTGVRNLMLFIVIGMILVYAVDSIDPSGTLYKMLRFNRTAILHGQVWRLFTYVFLSAYNPFVLLLVSLLYYRIGSIIENRCGVLKFNLYYLSGIVIIDILAMITGWNPGIDTFHYSLLLVYATLCPEDQMLLFFIIPIRMKYLAVVYLGLIALSLLQGNFFPLCAILNYLIFFGSDMKNLFPSIGIYHRASPKPKKTSPLSGPSPDWANRYHSKDGKRPYRHKCTVCGRTDTEHPELEFRYCSRCNGYYCYCIEHINNHTHIQ